MKYLGGMDRVFSNPEYQRQQKIYDMMQKVIKDTRPDLSQEVMAKLITSVETLDVLKDLGYVAQPLSAVQPTLRAVLYTMLYGRLDEHLFEAMLGSFKNMQERYISDRDIMFVHLFTERQFDSFVQLATKVEIAEGLNSEETLSFDCLYTTDQTFSVGKLKVLRSSGELSKLQGWQSAFKKDACYLLSVLTKETSKGKEETVRDYLVYIPVKYFEGFE